MKETDRLELELEASNKTASYSKFIQNIPNGKVSDNFFKYLSKLTSQETRELVHLLASVDDIRDLSADMLYGDPKSVIGRLFKVSSRGTGNGELAVAWLVNGAEIQGGSESYDVSFRGGRYEIKDWSAQPAKSSILAGVKSKVINFEFWYEVIDTLRRLDKLTGRTSGHAKFQLDRYFDAEFVELANKLLEFQGNILSGEVGKKKIKLLKDFYQKASKMQSEIQGYSNLILRGPNGVPIELSIEPISAEQIQGEAFQVKRMQGDQGRTYILTELRRLKYVRDPEAFEQDMQAAVDQVTEGITYIVFRKGQINFVEPGGFRPDVITISSLKFIEADV